MNHKLDTDTQVFFYEQEFYVLSNFSSFRVYFNGILHHTSEHAYHWQKFSHLSEDKLFNSYPSLVLEVKEAMSAHDCFKAAQRYGHLQREDWHEIRVGVMYEILKEKANQHEYVRRKLLETGDRELIEDSWRDRFWGWGPDKDGYNTLGKLWMELREELRNES